MSRGLAQRTSAVLLSALILTACTPATGPAGSAVSTPVDEATVVRAGEEWIAYQYGTPCGLTPSDPSVICLVRPDGSGRHALPSTNEGEAKHPDWSPDGMSLAFVYAGEIWVSNVDGSEQRTIASCGRDCFSLDYPAWSPTGDHIAFTRYSGPALNGGPPSTSAIDVVDVDSGNVRTTVETERLTLVDQPRWAPDGDRMVVQLEQFADDGTETGSAIAVLPASGGAPTPITDFALVATYPDWNPVDDTIVFASHEVDTTDEPVQLYTVQADGSGLTPLVFDGSDAQRSVQPSWTPDGQKIAFVDWVNRATTLVRPDGTGIETLSTFRASHPRLRPTP
ncbi:PD40 domain-containing protein [Microbacteriaceae bacterium VKM Ac-2855]|nr:PD40 domain-containing protein [Microbacteriaceae bacterium VKM Ac-2855]